MSEQNSPSRPTSSTNPKPKVFKPRAGIQRKSKAEREEYAKAEAERASARAVAAAQASTDREKTTQPLQQQGKSRIKQEGRDGVAGPSGGPGGVFGAGTGNAPGRKVVKDAGMSELLEGGEASRTGDQSIAVAPDGSGKKNTGSRADGGDKVIEKSGSGSGPGGKKAVDEDPGFDIDEEVDVEPKRDIERIWISSDEDEDQDIVSNKGKAKMKNARSTRAAAGLRPVRAPRILDDEPETDGPLKSRDRQIKSNRTVQEEADHETEGFEEDEMELDEDQYMEQETTTKHDLSSSPELSRRKQSKKFNLKTKEPRIAAETIEEKAERLRYKNDIRKLRNEFIMPQNLGTGNYGEDTEVNNAINSQETKMFLFQLPPLVPYLGDSENMPFVKQETTNVKKEPDDPTGDSDMPPPNLSREKAAKAPSTGLLTANEPLRLPGGRVGQLRVHKSGKVSLDWGGTDMEVRYGTEVDFLQDAVLIESRIPAADNKTEQIDARIGASYALGQVQKKMIVIPDWQKLYD